MEDKSAPYRLVENREKGRHRSFSPASTARWIEEQYYLLFGEPELSLIPVLCDPSRDAIDVGANRGCYTMIMRKYARHVVAYEPNPTLSSELAEKFDDDIWVKVETIALSRCKGTAALHIPMIDGKDVAGLASIDDIHPILNAEEHEIAVSTSALDDNFSGDVGFIKIDVEGHEVAVLEGAQTTIARCRPNALVELEERHAAGAVGRAHRYFAGLNYRGYFLRDGQVQPIEQFDPAKMQRPQDIARVDFRRAHTQPSAYTNNFLFIPAEQSDFVVSRIADALHAH